MKAHYFFQDKADEDDIMLKLCIDQGYVPKTCLLGGQIIFALVYGGENPCKGCQGPRGKCRRADNQEGI